MSGGSDFTRESAWYAARRRAANAALLLARAYQTGGDQSQAFQEFQHAGVDLTLISHGLDPETEPWDLARSVQLDREVLLAEGAGR